MIWAQIKADVRGKTIITPHLREGTCLGAAMVGGVAAGIYEDWRSAVEKAALREARKTHPREELYPAYSRYYQVHTALYSDLADRYRQLWSARES